jgi:hypothetical protein
MNRHSSTEEQECKTGHVSRVDISERWRVNEEDKGG